MALAFLFPGQNSRYPEMLQKLMVCEPANRDVLDHAGDVLGRDLYAHFRSGNPDIFARNRDVQIGVFLANHMHWLTLERAGVTAEYSAGLSLGEYNHLVHIGALSFEDALRVLAVRGEAYDNAPRGMMMAVLPVSPEQLLPIIAGQEDRLAIGMFNTPQQCVLSGARPAVEAAARRSEDELYAQAVVVDEELPMHSPLFRGVAEVLRPALQAAAWRVPRKPYLSNVRGGFVAHPSPADFADLLSAHPWQPVRWRDCVENLARAGEDIAFVEVGPKTVLSRFFGKRWLNPRRYSTDGDGDFRTTIEEIKEFRSGRARAASAD